MNLEKIENLYDAENANKIINNNYVVQKYFDDFFECIASEKYLSLEEAEITENYLNDRKNHLTYYKKEKCLAIVGIIPFNNKLAYIFNKDVPELNADDLISITCDSYEELMNCYVFHSEKISKKLLNCLVKEYYNRGGIKYENYYSFDRLELKKVRKERKKNYRNKIVFDYIFKHNFKEIERSKWSDGNIIIIEGEHEHCSFGYKPIKTTWI